jgi:hypothetical protein
VWWDHWLQHGEILGRAPGKEKGTRGSPASGTTVGGSNGSVRWSSIGGSGSRQSVLAVAAPTARGQGAERAAANWREDTHERSSSRHRVGGGGGFKSHE